MRTVASLRISTGSQGLESQRLAIFASAHRHGLTVQPFVEAQVASRQTGARRGLDTLREQVPAGDLMLVSERARLGRSVGQILPLVDRLLQHRVQLVAIKEHMWLNGTPDLQTKGMITMFGLCAEIEGDLMAEHTQAGLAAARAQGRLRGRPTGGPGTSQRTGREAEMQSLLAKTVAQASIAKMAVYLAAADKYRRLTHRLSQEQKGLGERALMVSPWPSHLWGRPRSQPCGRTSPAQAPSPGCFPPPRLVHTPAGCGHGGTRHNNTSRRVQP